MLVLSRKNDQSVVIGADDSLRGTVKVTVLEIGNGRVRLGFEANKDVPVHRAEVWERIRAIGKPECQVENSVAPRPFAYGGTGGARYVEKTQVRA